MTARVKLSDKVYEYILSQIISGAYPVDSRLPTETDLADKLGVSRPIVREALLRLRDDGVIASRQGSGSYVLRRPAKDVGMFSPIGSIADIQRCFVFRVAVEGEIAAIAARVRDPDGMTRLHGAFAALEIITEQGKLGVEEDVAFHRAVAEATGNHFFVATLQSLHDQIAAGMNLNRNLSLIQPRSRLLMVQVEHKAVVDAIEAGDEAGARTAMHTHLECARRRIFEGG